MKTLLLLLAFLGSLCSFAREKKLILHPNGKVQYEYETEGFMLDGRFACYYETGKLRVKGQFSGNQKTGLWRFWDEKGILRAERNYSDNVHFAVISQRDSSGKKIETEDPGVLSRASEPLFMQQFLSVINKADPANSSLFSGNGLAYTLVKEAAEGKITAFEDEKFVRPLNTASLSRYSGADITGFLIKEEYSCFSFGNPVMSSRVMGICPLVLVNGTQKELGWFYVPGITTDTAQLAAITDHKFSSLIVKTTINSPGFKWRDVSAGENELLRLMPFEFEASAILYTQDNLKALTTNR